PARRGGARGVFARGDQRRLLAGRQRRRRRGVLLLCLAGAAGLPRGAGASAGGAVRPGAAGVPPPVRSGARRAGSGGDAPRLPREHVRGGGGARRLGSRRPRVPAGKARRAATGLRVAGRTGGRRWRGDGSDRSRSRWWASAATTSAS